MQVLPIESFMKIVAALMLAGLAQGVAAPASAAFLCAEPCLGMVRQAHAL